MTGRLPTLFAEVGAEAHRQNVLPEAFAELGRRLCTDQPDRWGLCPTCGKEIARGNGQGHDPDSGCLTVIVVPLWHTGRLGVRLWRRSRHHSRRLLRSLGDTKGLAR